MTCAICRYGKTKTGAATVTLTRHAMTLVVKGVPARVCSNCGEEYVAETTAQRLIELADQAAGAGVQVEVREFVAA